jgi:hypothetical protein
LPSTAGGWPTDAHHVHHAHHRHHDAEGRHRVGHLGDHVRRSMRLVVVGLDLHVHQVLDLECVQVAAHHHAQVVGHELDRMVIGGNARVLGEDRAGVGVLDVVLDRHQALLAHLGEDLEQQREQINVKGLVVLRALHHLRQRPQRALSAFGPLLATKPPIIRPTIAMYSMGTHSAARLPCTA